MINLFYKDHIYISTTISLIVNMTLSIARPIVKLITSSPKQKYGYLAKNGGNKQAIN